MRKSAALGVAALMLGVPACRPGATAGPTSSAVSGEHTERCFALVPYAGKVQASLKGLGTGALPT